MPNRGSTITPRRKSRSRLLDEYVGSHDILIEDDVLAMSYRNVEGVLARYSKRRDVQFEYIGNGRYAILK